MDGVTPALMSNGDEKKVRRNCEDGKAVQPGNSEYQADCAQGSCKKLKVKSESDEISQIFVNPLYLEDDFKRSVRALIKLYGESTSNLLNVPLSNSAPLSMVFRKPFRHMIFPDFFKGPIDQLEDDLLAQKFQSLSSDLLQLSQTKELSSKRVEEFAALTKTFQDEVRPWVQDITGIDLKEEVDIRAAIYRYTDRLVCHDDRLSSRKVAYVYYLTDESWSAADGGSLDLFDSVCVNDNIVPGEIAKSILPKRNSLVLFIVCDDSFHQVSEVLSLRKPRLSVTGWFHLRQAPPPRIEYQETPEAQSVEIFSVTDLEMSICKLAQEDDVASEAIKAKMSKDFVKSKYATVQSLFTPKFYQELLDELREKDRLLPWVTPINRNEGGYYQYLDLRSRVFPKDPDHLDMFIRTFLTEQFLQSVTDITAVPICRNVHSPPLYPIRVSHQVPSSAGGTSGAPLSASEPERWFLKTIQLRLERFDHRSYTLKNFEAVQQGEALDLFYFIGNEKLESDCGGAVVYLDINESNGEVDPLYKFHGASNSLAMVLRDETTVFYTEYINHRWVRRNDNKPFYRLWMSIPATDLVESSYSSDDQESSSEDDDVENQPPNSDHDDITSSEEDEDEE